MMEVIVVYEARILQKRRLFMRIEYVRSVTQDNKCCLDHSMHTQV